MEAGGWRPVWRPHLESGVGIQGHRVEMQTCLTFIIEAGGAQLTSGLLTLFRLPYRFLWETFAEPFLMVI